ncbi:MAG: hypothetical protein DWI30_08640, partial [Chloroflexi bacterium]
MRAIVRIIGICVVFMLIYAVQTNAAAITQLTARVGQPVPPASRSVRLGSSAPIQVTAGANFNCALLYDGSVKCWGYNGEGQLGLGDMDDRGNDTNEMGDYLPVVDLGPNRTATAIQSGSNHTCAILDNGSVKCWGYNGEGQLGQGDMENRGDGPNEMGAYLLKVDLGTDGLGNDHTAKKISVGFNHSCAILDDNSIKCWGVNAYGRLGLGDQEDRGDATGEMGDNLPVVDLGTSGYAVTISAGGAHTCALLNNATVKCWGYNADGQLGYENNGSLGESPNQMGAYLAVVNVGTNRTVTGIFAGPYFTCATLDNTTSKCWGNSDVGQLGYGNTTQLGDDTGEMTNLAALNLGGNTASAFVTSRKDNLTYDFVCVVLTTGKIRCWGHNGQGQLGYGNTTDRVSVPGSLSDIDLGTNRTVLQLAMGESHVCAILDNYDLKCWGRNQVGQLGYGDDFNRGDDSNEMGINLGSIDVNNTSTPFNTPTFSNTRTNTSTPSNTPSNTRTNTSTPSNTPLVTDTPSQTPTKTKTPTKSKTVTRSKTPTRSKTRTATPVGGVKEVVSIATGALHACAMLANDTVKCWGYNDNGQLGYGNITARGDGTDEMGSNLAAVDLGSGRTAKAISAGVLHTCVILDNSTVKCWGENSQGQLGQGHSDNRGDDFDEMGSNLAAVDLGSGRTAKAISAGYAHTCAILDDDTVKCWGLNNAGQLGYDDITNRGDDSDEMGSNLAAVNLGSGRTAKAIATGYYHTCALLDDNTLKCWGLNVNGQLGLGDKFFRGNGNSSDDYSSGNYRMASLATVDVGARTISQLIVGGFTTCVLFDAGTVACWGLNDNGQLGIGTTNNRGDESNEMGTNLQLVDLGSGHTAKSINANYYHTCAILDDDTVKCWGYNQMGQLGYGDTTKRGYDLGQMGDNLATVNLGDDLTAKQISLGSDFTCALLNTNNLKCWGNNTWGQLGYNDTDTRGKLSEHMGKYLPPIPFGTVLTSTPT